MADMNVKKKKKKKKKNPECHFGLRGDGTNPLLGLRSRPRPWILGDVLFLKNWGNLPETSRKDPRKIPG
jgi:hypothetical protein